MSCTIQAESDFTVEKKTQEDEADRTITEMEVEYL